MTVEEGADLVIHRVDSEPGGGSENHALFLEGQREGRLQERDDVQGEELGLSFGLTVIVVPCHLDVHGRVPCEEGAEVFVVDHVGDGVLEVGLEHFPAYCGIELDMGEVRVDVGGEHVKPFVIVETLPGEM